MSKEKENKVVEIDDAELNKANEASEDEIIGKAYEHIMSRPFTYEGKTYEKLVFDWYKLTGDDSLAIENEMSAQGKILVAPEFSGEYLLRMASRACEPPIASDVIRAMPLTDFNKIRNHARSFLLKSAQ